jgi:hypothetical protein
MELSVFLEDWELAGEQDDFEADFNWLVADCKAHLEDAQIFRKEPPSRWPGSHDRVLKSLYSIDYRMAHQLDARHQELTGRHESFFGYVLKIMEEPISSGGPVIGEDACLVSVGWFSQRWGIAIESGNKSSFHDFLGLLMERVPLVWDVYKVPERIKQRINPS